MTRGLNTLKNILALWIKTCFGAFSVCHTHTHAQSNGKECFWLQCHGLFVAEGTLPVREVRRVALRDTAFEDEPSHAFTLPDPHITDAFGRVRLSTLMYALPFTLQPFRSDSRGTSKWHVCMKHKNTAPPLNNCGELVMMTSALTAPEGGRGASVFAFGRCTLASRGRLLYRLPSQRFLTFLLLFSKF